MGDDQAGLMAAELLEQRKLPGTVVTADEAPGLSFAADPAEGVELLIVIDAAQADENHPPGTHARIDYRQQSELLPYGPSSDTHSIGVQEALALADSLHALPPEVWIYVLFGQQFNRSMTMGDAVARGLSKLVDCVEQDIQAWLAAHKV